MIRMSDKHTPSPVTREWIGALSEKRIGQTWRLSDHEELLRNLRLADELTILLLQRARVSPVTDETNHTAEVTGSF